MLFRVDKNFDINDVLFEYFQIMLCKTYNQISWENGVPFLYGQHSVHTLHYINVDGWYCFYVKNKDICHYIVSPVHITKTFGSYSDLLSVVEKLQCFGKICKSQIIEYVTYNDDIVQSCSNSHKFRFHLSKLQSFIFDKQKILNMKGRCFQNKRTLINKFKKTHPFAIVRVATLDDIDNILRVRKLWLQKKISQNISIIDDKSFIFELKFMLDLDRFGNTVYVCEENSNVLGYVSLCFLCKDTIQTIHRNCVCLPEYSGLSDYLFVEALKMFEQSYKYIADGNGGYINSSLYFWKVHYNPIDMVKTGFIDLR